MMKYIVGPICIGRIIIGSLIMSIATSNFILTVRAASLQKERIDHIGGKENEEKLHLGFSSMSGGHFFEKYGIQQRMETKYNHKEETLEARWKTLGNAPETGRSFIVIHMFLKTMKKTLKSLRPEIKLSECAQKYFFSTSESETPVKPTHNHGHNHDKKKKKKKKHKHDPHKDYSDHITDGVVSSVFGLHSDFASIIYEEYRPYLHIARSVYKNVKSTFEVLRQDALMKCTVDYLVARFCIWVDG